MALTAKQRRFIDEYFVNNMNATRAALASGYSERTAAFIGAENLKKPKIAEEIERRLNEMAIPANEVLSRLAEQARAAYSEYLTNAGVDIDALLAAGKGHLIKKLKPVSLKLSTSDNDIEHYQAVEVEFYDAQSALVNLGKYHKLFTDRQELSGPGGGPIAVKGYTTVSPDDWDEDDS